MWHSRPPRDPPPFMANAILNFHFDYLNPSLIENAQHLVISCHHDSFRFNNIFFSFNFKFIPGKLNSNIDLFMALVCHQVWKHLWLCIFFLSWLAAKSFITFLTLESFIPTSMLSINKMDYVARRNIECFWSSDCSRWYSYLASSSSSSCLVLSRVPAWLVLTYCSNSFSRSMLTTIVAGNRLKFRYP